MKRLLYIFFTLCALVFFVPSADAAIYTNEKLITVDLGSQTLTAWQDGKIQHQTKVSTGMKLTPTVKGNFSVYMKNPLHDMRGPSPYKNIYPSGKYHIKNVPHSLYFYQGCAIALGLIIIFITGLIAASSAFIQKKLENRVKFKVRI